MKTPQGDPLEPRLDPNFEPWPDPDFEPWLEQQLRCSAQAMLSSISPVSIVKQRPGFGQTVRPVAGSIVASPVLGAYDPDPDYFFHWFRDSAVVIDALRLLYIDGRIGDDALRHLRDFTRFSLSLNALDGRVDAAVPDRTARAAPDFLQFLRSDDDLQRAHGDAVVAETRVNPDGTLDVSRWARPQHDGPPLRALAMLRWMAVDAVDAALRDEIATLIRFDLDFTLAHWHEPSYEIWEEDNGHHYYTLRVSAAALADGAAWLDSGGETDHAQRCRAASHAVLAQLDGYWVADVQEDDATCFNAGLAHGHYRSRILPGDQPSTKALDIAVILSAIHTCDADVASTDAHGVADPRMHATLARLEALFHAAYAINHGLRAGRGPAMGRYAGDVYYSGGAYYFSTLGAAEFCFRCAALDTSDAAIKGQAWFARGDAYLATVRAHTPASGELSEQFDQTSGAQTSARQLAWSHAAFISCVAARTAAHNATLRRIAASA